jgi:2,4-dienoyl-CoA reductase (NADPH2)
VAGRARSGAARHAHHPDLIVGTLLSRSGDLAPASTRLTAAGVAFVKQAVRSVSTAPSSDRFTGERTTVKAEALVDAGPRLPAEDAAPNAGETDADGHVLRAGDAVAPRTIYEAILEGRRVALGVEGRS